jgi:hypothetical protein
MAIHNFSSLDICFDTSSVGREQRQQIFAGSESGVGIRGTEVGEKFWRIADGIVGYEELQNNDIDDKTYKCQL